METPPPDPARPDPDALLRARLRDTTPEFEQRFDALRRRLAQETPAPWWSRFLPAWSRPLGVGLAAAALVALASVFLLRPPALAPLSDTETAAFLEMAALDDSLANALALTDPETLDALLHLPLN